MTEDEKERFTKVFRSRKGFVWNCVIQPRNTTPRFNPFVETDEGLLTQLNGYAIIPLEEYAELTGEDYSDILLKMREADEVAGMKSRSYPLNLSDCGVYTAPRDSSIISFNGILTDDDMREGIRHYLAEVGSGKQPDNEEEGK